MSFPTSARTNNKWAVAHLGTIQAAPIDCDPQSELTGWLLFDTVHADEAENTSPFAGADESVFGRVGQVLVMSFRNASKSALASLPSVRCHSAGGAGASSVSDDPVVRN